METCGKKEKRQFNKYDMAIDFFVVSDISWHWYFLCWRFYDNVGCRVGSITIWRYVFPSGASGLICHAVITLRRNDK